VKLPTIRRLDRLVVSGAGKTDAVRRSTYFWEATLTDENSQHCLPQGYQQQGPRDSHRLARFQLSFTLPPVGEEHCGVYVCLPVFVCLFSGNTRLIFTVARSYSGGVATRYVLLVLLITSYFHVMGHVIPLQ